MTGPLTRFIAYVSADPHRPAALPGLEKITKAEPESESRFGDSRAM
jgi:hypothetical protein